MTRPSKREIERALEDLADDEDQDGVVIDHVVVTFGSGPEETITKKEPITSEPAPEDTVTVTREGEERCQMTVAEYEAEYGPIDEIELVADFTETST